MCPRCAFTAALRPVAGSTAALAAAVLRPGGALAHFEILDELGRGAMGQVWLARDTRLDRLVALKTLPADAGGDAALGARLEREARTAAALRHPHIVAVHDLGRTGATVWLALEFLEGGDLRSRIRERPLPARDAAQLGAQLADALEHAHRAGVLHRDVKPSNVLLDEHGAPKLGDFGLATSRAGASDLTMPGQVLGTPAYLAPEQLRRGAAPSVAADVYALGAVLYETLTGRPPFVADTPAALLAAAESEEPVSPELLRPGLPRDLATIVLKCLEKEPARRYAAAEDLAADLIAFLAGQPIRARPVSAAGRAWRWAKREPALAGTLAATVVLLAAVATTATVAAVRINQARAQTAREAERATRAEAAMREELRGALLARARATRLSGRTSQRFEALAALRDAAKIRPGSDLRDEAVLALTVLDVRATRNDWPVRQSADQTLALDAEHGRYAVEVQPGRWEVRTVADAKLQCTLESRAARADSAPAFSDDGRWFVVRAEDAVVRVWSLAAPGAPVLELPDRRYILRGSVRSYGAPDVVSPDGRWLASAVEGGGFSLHALPDGTELARVPTPQPLTVLAFSRDGKQLAVGRGLRGAGGEARFYLATTSLAAPTELRPLPVAENFQSLDWSGDGRLLLVGQLNSTAFEVATGRRVFSARDPEADYAFFGPSDRLIFTVGKAGSLRAWDLTGGEQLLRGIFGSNAEISWTVDRHGLLRPQGVTELGQGVVELPTVAQTLPAISPDGWDNTAHLGVTLAFSPDGKLLAESTWGTVYLRDAATGRVCDALHTGTPNDFTSALFAADGRTLFVGAEGAGLLRAAVKETPDGPRLGTPETLDAERGYILADATNDGGTLLLVDHRRGKQAKVLRPGGNEPAVRWSYPQPSRGVLLENGATALLNGLGGMGKEPLTTHDTRSGAAHSPLGAMQGYEVSRSRDGRWVLCGTGAKTSELRRTADWSPGPALPPELQGAAKATAFSPDGNMVAIAAGNVIALVRTTDGAVVARLSAAQSGVFATEVAFSPDGRRLAVLWRFGALTLWDLPELRRELGALGLDW